MKLVILILVGVLVVFAVGAWASFSRPKAKAPTDPQKEAKVHKGSRWEDGLAWLHGPPGENPLLKSVYHSGDPAEVIKPAAKTRQVKLRITHREGCSILIEYIENDPRDKTLGDQPAHLPRTQDEGKDDHKDDATFMLTKTGGTLHFGTCSQNHKNGCPARIEVVK